MTAFLIDDASVKRLQTAIARARAKPIPWHILRRHIPAQNEKTNTLTLADRRSVVPPREPETVMLPLGWRVAITCEDQPAGMLLHISMSSPAKGRTPIPRTSYRSHPQAAIGQPIQITCVMSKALPVGIK